MQQMCKTLAYRRLNFDSMMKTANEYIWSHGSVISINNKAMTVNRAVNANYTHNLKCRKNIKNYYVGVYEILKFAM